MSDRQLLPLFVDRGLADTVRSALEGRELDPVAGAELDWFGIGIDPDVGGSGGELADLSVVVDVVGAEVAASMVGWTAGLVGPLVAREGSGEVLDALVSGTAVAAVPVLLPGALSGLLDVDAGRVSGSFIALGPADAAYVAVPLVVDGERVVAVWPAGPEGAHLERVAASDPTRPFARVRLDGAHLASAAVVVRGADVHVEWVWRTALVLALDSAGTARTALAKTVAYSLQREQFGRLIGSFQAYKHRCATALVELRLAQSAAHRAAAAPPEEVAQAALAAALLATANATEICGEAVQLHGGIGFTWEAGIHAHLKRARINEVIARGGHDVARGLLAGG